jgi:hypothetical protein
MQRIGKRQILAWCCRANWETRKARVQLARWVSILLHRNMEKKDAP